MIQTIAIGFFIVVIFILLWIFYLRRALCYPPYSAECLKKWIVLSGNGSTGEFFIDIENNPDKKDYYDRLNKMSKEEIMNEFKSYILPNQLWQLNVVYNNNIPANAYPLDKAWGPYPANIFTQWVLDAGCVNTSITQMMDDAKKAELNKQTPRQIKAFINNYAKTPRTQKEADLCYTGKKLTDFPCDPYITGPYPQHCLTKWWAESGCTDPEWMLDAKQKEWMDSVDVNTLKADMKKYATPDTGDQLKKCHGKNPSINLYPLDKALGPYNNDLLKIWFNESGCSGEYIDNLSQPTKDWLNSRTPRQIKDEFSWMKKSPMKQWHVDACTPGNKITDYSCDMYNKGPYPEHCLLKWWEETKCPNKNIDMSDSNLWHTQFPDIVKADMKSYAYNPKEQRQVDECYGVGKHQLDCSKYTIGPYPRHCLLKWWEEAGCTNKNIDMPDSSWWHTQTPDVVKANMRSYAYNSIEQWQLDDCYGAGKYTLDCSKYTKGPYPRHCLLKWLEEAGCANKNINIPDSSWWHSQTPDVVKADMRITSDNPKEQWQVDTCYGKTSDDKSVYNIDCDIYTKGPYPKHCLLKWFLLSGCTGRKFIDLLPVGGGDYYANKNPRQIREEFVFMYRFGQEQWHLDASFANYRRVAIISPEISNKNSRLEGITILNQNIAHNTYCILHPGYNEWIFIQNADGTFKILCMKDRSLGLQVYGMVPFENKRVCIGNAIDDWVINPDNTISLAKDRTYFLAGDGWDVNAADNANPGYWSLIVHKTNKKLKWNIVDV
jgi:hypothetical protein